MARLTVTDNAGNTNTADVNFIWDTTAPSITINPVSPDPTGDSTPSFTGNTSDALSSISAVEYSVDGGAWLACLAADGNFNSSNENYVCTIAPALIEGVHSVNVRARDFAGNQSDGSLSDSFTVNLSGPTITPMSDRAEKVQFSQSATTTGATSWTWSYSGPGVITFGTPNAEDTTISADTDGVYTITLTANDGFFDSFESFLLTWDTTAPDITINPVAPDPTDDLTPTFTGNAVDTFLNIVGVQYQVDGGAWTACSAVDGSFNSNSEDYSCTTTTLSEGVHTVNVRSLDSLNNQSDGSVSDTFTIDSSAPIITITDSDLGVINTPTAAGASATDANGIASYSWAKVSGPGIINFSPSNGVADPTLAADTDGAYVARLTVTDGVGISSTADVSFIWDTTAPSITITDSDLGTINTPTAAGASATDTNGVASYTWTKISGPGNALFSPSGNIANPSFSADISGSYVVRLAAADVSGNTSTADVDFIWDGSPQGLVVTNPVGGEYLQGGSTFNDITWTLTDPGNLDFFSIDYSINSGSSWTNIATTSSSTRSLPWSVPEVDSASSSVRVIAYDTYSNSSTGTSTNFTIDSTDPEISLISPNASSQIKGGSHFNISYNISDNFGVDYNVVSLDYSLDGGSIWYHQATTTLPFGLMLENATTTQSTSTRLRVTTYDRAGNSKSDTTPNFVIDSYGPVINITNHDLGTISTSTAAGVSVTDDYSGLASMEWTKQSGPGNVIFNSSSTIANPEFSADTVGTYVVLLTATDNVDYVSTDTVTFIWPEEAPPLAVNVGDDVVTNVQINKNATTTGASSWDWTYSGPGVITFGAPNAEDTTISADTDGIYTVTLTAGNGLTSSSDSFQLTWDTTAPVITTTNSNLGTISAPANSGTSVVDALGTAHSLWTKISGPGAINFAPGNDVADPYFSATLTGSYVVGIEALDDVGNSASSTISFAWSGDPATPYFTNPSVNSYLRGGVANNVSWVSSGEDDLDYFSLWYSDDVGANWNLLDGSIASTTSVFSWNTPLVDASGQLLKLSVFDVSTNSTTTLSLPFTIDSTPPNTVVVSNPDALSLPWQGASTKTITWTGGDDLNLGATPILLEYSASGNFDDTVVMANVANSGSYNWTVPSVNTVLGAKIRVTATDLAGNQRVATSSAFIIDSLAPSLTLDADFGDTTAAFSPDPVIVDNVDTAGELSYSWSVVSVPAGASLYFSVPFIANPNISGDLAGVYTMALTITDRAGNSVTEQSSFNWSGGSIYPEIIYPTTGDHVPAGTVNIIWTTPNVDNLDHYKIEYSDDAGFSWSPLISNITAPATSSPWTIAANTNSSNNMIRVTAYDSLDAPYAANSGLFIIDSTAPVIDLGSNLGTISAATTVTATASDNFDAANELTYSWSVLSAPSGANLTISSSTILTPALSGSVNGAYLALLTVTDRAGNSASSSVAFTWYVSSGGGGGGGGGSTSYCAQVEYGPWSTCVNGFQTRLVINRSPLLCTLNTAQQLALTQTCTVVPEVPEVPVVEEPTVPETETPSSSYPFDPEAVDVIENARKSFTKLDQALVNAVIGRIVLQVEDRGRAWYINPKDGKKYYLGRPTNAFQVMRILGDGIVTANLERIPVGIMDGSLTMDIDTDKDGLPDRLEKGLRTDWKKADTDGDGHSDYLEVAKGYDPLSKGKPKTDLAFTKKNNGRIFIQVQQNGEAWYVDPISQRRFYLGRPLEALAIMRDLGLGISNKDLNKIPVGTFSEK